MNIIGIETSCDETAVAIVQDKNNKNGPGKIIANIIHSQNETHKPFAGVVPELAARKHIEIIDETIKQTLKLAKMKLNNIDAVAVATGPGLVGGLIIGAMTARTIAKVHGKTLWTINHLEGHALSGRLSHGIKFPYIALLLSGGHTQIIMVEDVGKYHRWATTIDDAVGEAFDKIAKMMGLEYPGGPKIEQYAKLGDGEKYKFPRPLTNGQKNKEKMDMSFSGLKTAVRKILEDDENTQKTVGDICASFQNAVADVLEDRVKKSMEKFEKEMGHKATVMIGGGVGSNEFIADRLRNVIEEKKWKMIVPPKNLCTDNAAMIAWAGIERMKKNMKAKDCGIKPRWPLDENAKTKMGKGKKGAKV